MANYEFNITHLYGNLVNTCGDDGNLLMSKYVAERIGVPCHAEIVSVHKPFDANKYDLVSFGGGQDSEQLIISKDIQRKRDSLVSYIEDDGVMLAIRGGYQSLGHYYMGINREKIQGISALDHHTLSQENNRFIGNIAIHNEEFNETYYGLESHNGRVFLGKGERPLGRVV